MKAASLCAVLAMLACSGCGLQGETSPRSTVAAATQASPDDLERQIIEQVNAIRLRNGLQELVVNEQLVAVSRDHSRYMLRQGRLNHRGEGGSTPAQRVERAGLPYRQVGENLGRNEGYADPVRTVVDGWMKSPPHRENILRKDFRQTGAGVVRSQEGEYWITQLFFTPR